jgi:carbamoyl-phosphate synthase small subunit
MPRRNDIAKILVIGSGPIVIRQYHPEASSGPHDSHYLFKDFRKMMEEFKK